MLTALGPSLVIAAGLIVIMAGLGERLPPRNGERGIEAIIVREQLRRAVTIRPAVLIVGDSSALMGVDAGRLSRNLGMEVESLATLGWVGPAGYGHFVSMVSRAFASPRVVILLMSGAGLVVDEGTFVATGYEKQVLGTTGRGAISVRPESWRDRTYNRIFLALVDPPLPGSYGSYYGWPESIGRVLQRDHGSMIDPTVANWGVSGNYRFEVSEAVQRRLPRLADTVGDLGVGRLYFAITPIPQPAVGPDTILSRAEALAHCTRLLRISEGAILPTPVALPQASFATFTHLNEAGRQSYTDTLARVLAARDGVVDVVAPARP